MKSRRYKAQKGPEATLPLIKPEPTLESNPRTKGGFLTPSEKMAWTLAFKAGHEYRLAHVSRGT